MLKYEISLEWNSLSFCAISDYSNSKKLLDWQENFFADSEKLNEATTNLLGKFSYIFDLCKYPNNTENAIKSKGKIENNKELCFLIVSVNNSIWEISKKKQVYFFSK